VCLLLLQEDAQELADPIRLARLIKQYSQFIQFPIKLWSAKKEAKQVRTSTPWCVRTERWPSQPCIGQHHSKTRACFQCVALLKHRELGIDLHAGAGSTAKARFQACMQCL
jgi:hypothetical protein